MAVDLVHPVFKTPCAIRHADIKAHLECWRLTASSNLADPTTVIVIKPCLHTTPRKVNAAFKSALSNLRALSTLMNPIGAECAHPARVDLYAAPTHAPLSPSHAARISLPTALHVNDTGTLSAES